MEILKDILAVIGGIVIVLTLIDLLFNLFPKFRELKTKFWTSIAGHFKFRRLQKKAIASSIEETVNETVKHLKDELPPGWINQASIEWVKTSDFVKLHDGEVILRLKPLESQDFNLLNGVYYFFSNVLFPNTSEIIPSNIKKASTLQISKRTLSNKHPYLTNKFKKEILDEELKLDSSIAEYFGKYEELDKCGYFTGTFIREIDSVSEEARYNELRTQIEKEISEILNHLIKFYKKNEEGHVEKDLWTHEGFNSTYGLLLVARPSHTGIKAYLKRAKERQLQGADRLYLLGCNQEKIFVRRVIEAIKKIPGFELVEFFNLHRDYRGVQDGIGAVFNIKKNQN